MSLILACRAYRRVDNLCLNKIMLELTVIDKMTNCSPFFKVKLKQYSARQTQYFKLGLGLL